MPPKKQWDEEEGESSTPPSSPPTGAVRRKAQFDDEEGDDSDVLDSWDAAEDSEVEREKVKKAADAKAKADAEAAANKKSKAQRVKEHKEERARRLAESGDETSDDESEAQKRERLRRTEQEADLAHAADLFGDAGLSVGGGVSGRKTNTVGTAVAIDATDPSRTVNIATLPLFNPITKTQFETLRDTLVPILGAHSKKAHYTLFMQELTKQLLKDLPSDQIKKISSTLITLGNEKMKEEKQTDKGGKKTKAQKTKSSLVANRPSVNDTSTYEESFNDDDFM